MAERGEGGTLRGWGWKEGMGKLVTVWDGEVVGMRGGYRWCRKTGKA